MKLRVWCGSKCGGSQPRTRRIPPGLGLAGGPSASIAPATTPVFSRSRRLGPRLSRGESFSVLTPSSFQNASAPAPTPWPGPRRREVLGGRDHDHARTVRRLGALHGGAVLLG